MEILHEVAAVAGHAIGLRAGSEKLASHKLAEGVAPTIQVTSIAFEADSALPISCTADGVGAPPALSFEGIPEGAQSLLVLCEDPDAPLREPFVHWLAYDLPPKTASIDAQTQHDYLLGENSRSEAGFTPAAPPAGHGVHHYHFQVFGLDIQVALSAGRDRAAVLEAAKGHVVGWGEIVGTYER